MNVFKSNILLDVFAALLFVLSPVEGGRCAVIADGFGVGELVAHEVGAGGEGEEEEEEAGGRDHCGQGRGGVI